MSAAPSVPFQCALCLRERPDERHGHNPAPLLTQPDARCCSECNAIVVFVRICAARTGQRINRRNWLTRIRTDYDNPDLVRVRQMFGGVPAVAPVSLALGASG